MEPSVKLHTHGRHVCGRTAEVEGDVFKYKGARSSVGVIKILEPVSPMLNYFEYVILDKGRKCALGIGVGDQNYPNNKMPGWQRNGIGYHADDGRLFHQNGSGRQYGPLCTTGDRMGCGLDFDSDPSHKYVTVFFTKNGELVGDPVQMKRPVFGLYPLVGLHSEGEKVQYLGHWRRTMSSGSIAEPMDTSCSPGEHWLRCNGVAFLDDSLTLQYAGDGLNKQDVGMAQALHCISPTNHYFELEILDAGKEGWIAIGLAKRTYNLTKHPGWCNGSIGYHADNGHLYNEKGMGDEFGPTCGTGDTMGCGVRFSPDDQHAAAADEDGADSDSSIVDHFSELNLFFGMDDDDYYDPFDDDDEPLFGRRPYGLFGGRAGRLLERAAADQRKAKKEKAEKIIKKCTVYFTKNGELVGETECVLPSGGFYPVVAMLSSDEKIRVNLRPLTG